MCVQVCRQYSCKRSLNVEDTVITNQQFKYHKNFYNSITAPFYSSANSLGDVFVSLTPPPLQPFLEQCFLCWWLFFFRFRSASVWFGFFPSNYAVQWKWWALSENLWLKSWQTKMENDLAYFMHAHRTYTHSMKM